MRAVSFSFAGNPGARRGSVILFVLGVVLLASFLLSLLIARASGELLVESRAAREGTLRAEAYSALEVTLAVLADVAAADGALHGPAQGWSDPLAYADYTPATGTAVEVFFEDETGKLPLADAEPATLHRYFEALGVAPADAERLVDALSAWTDAAHIAVFPDTDPARYGDAATPYAPPGRALRSFEELRAVAIARDLFFDADGRWNELGERFRADATLHRFGQVNINSARPAVLVALGLDPTAAITAAERLAISPDGQPQYFRTVPEAAAVASVEIGGADLGAAVQCLRIRIVVRQGAAGVQLDAVIMPGGGVARPPAAGATAPANEPGTLPVEPRPASIKRVDYPFRVLELRESPAPAS